jgi:hypothetical protein
MQFLLQETDAAMVEGPSQQSHNETKIAESNEAKIQFNSLTCRLKFILALSPSAKSS